VARSRSERPEGYPGPSPTPADPSAAVYRALDGGELAEGRRMRGWGRANTDQPESLIVLDPAMGTTLS